MSSNKNKKYWKNLAELNPLNNSALESLGQKEFIEEIPVDEFLGDDKNLSNSSTKLEILRALSYLSLLKI